MTASDFTAWVDLMRKREGWSDLEITRRLGCGESMVRTWKKRDPPKYIGLACTALALGHPAWKAPAPRGIKPEDGR